MDALLSTAIPALDSIVPVVFGILLVTLVDTSPNLLASDISSSSSTRARSRSTSTPSTR
ncbi:hypothetical protein OB919_01485 [Halobacteria archaeon AArc-curdl1]|uniref:Uncharacterized protein n=1 Tax=Natronosalvus hydrolyticus TaxID=2979988 RepID=A0AAP2Z4N7_9EURY|nr:hypothetical protein [Halobacteria archaeon AArc-curdl1]